jgi:hypothetical protein
VRTVTITTKTGRITGGRAKDPSLMNRIEIGEDPNSVEPKSIENDEIE